LDALVPALVAALLAGVGDRAPRLAALLAARGSFSSVVAGLILGHILAIAIAVAGAAMIAPLMAPNARSLLLAIALVLAGLGGLWQRAVAPPTGNAFVVAATGSFVGIDGTAFLAFALAVGRSSPILAGVGALAGALVLAIGAACAGRDWERVPVRLLGRIGGILLLVTGVIVALGALRLI
jgi:putative Ca2+/H+ antiporter (TMEM165/GDT1 family)